jgi:hypothetical protein
MDLFMIHLSCGFVSLLDNPSNHGNCDESVVFNFLKFLSIFYLIYAKDS